MSRDIIIHYDEAAGKIVCSTVEHASTAPLLAKALPLEIAVEYLQQQEAAEAERSFGAGVLALLDMSAIKKMGIRDYHADTSTWAAENTAELKEKSRAGDAASQYELALELIATGLRAKSKKNMTKADGLLRQAAEAGHGEAAEYLAELWPALKARSEDFK